MLAQLSTSTLPCHFIFCAYLLLEPFGLVRVDLAVLRNFKCVDGALWSSGSDDGSSRQDDEDTAIQRHPANKVDELLQLLTHFFPKHFK